MLRLKLLHIDGLDEEEEPSKHLTFGSTLHNVLEAAHAGSEAPTREDLFEWLKAYWVDHETRIYSLKRGIPLWAALGYESEEEEKEAFEEAMSILDDYYVAQIQDNYRQAWALEVYHNVPLPGYQYSMSVKIDRIDKLDDGRYRIVDYKTSKRAESPEKLSEDLQVLLYAWAVHYIYGIPYEQIAEVGMYYLRHQKFVTPSAPIDQFTVGTGLYRVQQVIEKAERGEFHPNKGWWCKFCQARSACPAVQAAS